jgi:hypothetical protein
MPVKLVHVYFFNFGIDFGIGIGFGVQCLSADTKIADILVSAKI